MTGNHSRLAFIYDFDLTLTEEYQQMPILRAFASQLERRYRIKPEEYFEVLCGREEIEIGVGAMQQFILDVQNSVFYGISSQTMQNYYARQIQLSPGLPEWFPRINEQARRLGLTLEHHVVSAGFTPLIEGSVIAIDKEGKKTGYLASIRSGTFIDNEKGLYKIKTIVDPNNKRDEITKICKGEGKKRHENIPLDQYYLRYDHVIVFGDGHSDQHMFNFIRERGGIAVGVYEKGPAEGKEGEKEGGKEKALQELGGKVHYLVPRDYSPGTPLEKVVQESLEMIASRKCDFDYQDIHKFLLRHLENREQLELSRRHLQHCADCLKRGKETKVY